MKNMKLSIAIIWGLLLASLVIAQDKPILEKRGELEFADAQQQEQVVAYKFVSGENRLVLVGKKVVRVLDVTSAKFVESRPIEVPEFNEDRPRVISPDGRRMVVFGNYDSRKKEDKVKRAPSVWDLQTGKQIAVLNQTTKPIRAAIWSMNGKTLATSSDKYAPTFNDSSSVEVSFWDGETLAYKNSLPTDKVGWWQLSEDGTKCIYSTGEVKNLFLVFGKYVNSEGPIGIWDIGGGKIEQTITAHAGKVERKISAVQISPDGKFLTFVAQPPNSKETERRLSVWEIDETNAERYEISPRYEIAPDPKLSKYGVTFSPSGKYFALDVGKNLEIYETRTGEKRFEVLNFDQPSGWFTDQIVYNNYFSKMKAYDVATGKQLYQNDLIYDVFTYKTMISPDDNAFSNTETVVVDQTKIIAHPSGKMFLTYSNQYVKVFDSQTGTLLQTLVSPQMDYTGKKPKLSNKSLVNLANWSTDGKTLYIISADRKRVSLWRLL